MLRLLLFLSLALTACAAGGASPLSAERPRVPTLVELPRTRGGVALFFGEREMLRRAVADHLSRKSKRQLQPLGDLAMDVLYKRIAQDKKTCAAPTSPRYLLLQEHPGALEVAIYAECVRQCVLRAVVLQPGEDGKVQPIENWQAPVSDPTTANGWVAAVGALQPGPPGFYLGDALPRPDPEHPLEAVAVSSVHEWGTKPDRAWFTSAQAGLDACHVSGGFKHRYHPVTVEVSPQGRIARCESSTLVAGASPEPTRCACRAMKALTFPAGPRGRRLEVLLRNRGEAAPEIPAGAKVSLLGVSEPGQTLRPILVDAQPSLAACTRAAPKTTGHLRVGLTIDGQGHSAPPVIIESSLSAPVNACAAKVLSQLAFPCPAKRAPVRFEVNFRFRQDRS